MFHTLKVTADRKIWACRCGTEPTHGHFHSLLLFCILLLQQRPYTTPPLKSDSTVLNFTEGKGIRTHRSNMADIQSYLRTNILEALKNIQSFHLSTRRLS
jgi:hypothetical protein